ncbi:MAG: hypothetical protein ABID54_13320 [Pseudomonadota bacterium]
MNPYDYVSAPTIGEIVKETHLVRDGVHKWHVKTNYSEYFFRDTEEMEEFFKTLPRSHYDE